MGKGDKLELAYEKVRYRTVSRNNKGAYYIDKICWINDAQFKQFVNLGIIGKDMTFDTKLFKEMQFRAQFRADYEMALKSLEATGKLPDGTKPVKEATPEDLSWNKTPFSK